MNNVEKLRVLLQHWIDHNKGHVEEFENWRKLMTDDSQEKIAGHITEAIKLMATVNAELGKALHEVGGSAGAGDQEHHHHPHTHEHSHDHSHDHHDGHSHDHDHAHSHSHDHNHDHKH
ncbi:hypothetical protein [Desulforhopalus sp. IMCC35007]|uniref:hypothetical protein n=1 Tax=Desulforhopalus sp. IMCC35007 TaxID=2569543 RepID=UPI00197AE233|nr:hypothetical protein [Desulforhopalus sp. IMCC35007]